MTTAQLLEISDYAAQARDFLAKSRDFLAIDDLHQASEKGWGAASHMAKAVAAAQGWEYTTHAHFFGVLTRVSQMTGNPYILDLRAIANELHGYYYMRKRELVAAEIGRSLGRIAELLELLAPLTVPPEGG